MGCVSSRHFRKDLKREILLGNGGDYTHHVVSLTSSTYGLLNLDKEQTHHHQQQPIKEIVMETKRSPPREEEEPPEVINAWELMEDLEEGGAHISIHQPKRSPIPPRRSSSSPLKFLNSPKKFKKLGGKENNQSPKIRVPKSPNLQDNNSRKITPILKMKKGSSTNEGSRVEMGVSSRRRSLGPLFDPDLIESYQKELTEEEEQIKNMVSVSRTPTNQKSLLPFLLQSIPSKSPPGGENTVVIYTTTLRGIRKTFENCNKARSIIESHQVQMIERDVSMDSGFREELRGLMGTKEVRVPAVFVKGRLIGGAEELVSLEEGGKLGILLAGIPRGVARCDGCAGVRFVMCMECSGSCKVLGEDGRKTVRCEECNENGLIHCPICC